MKDTSTTHRFTAALTALLFALGWGLPSIHAACGAPGSMAPEHHEGTETEHHEGTETEHHEGTETEHHGGTETEHHCDGHVGASYVYLTHHAGEDARAEYVLAEKNPSVDPLTMGGGDQPVRPSDSIRKRSTAFSLFSTGPAIRRAHRPRAHVGVWLE